MKEISIQNNVVKVGGKPFTMAEAGINHNGDLNRAYEMIKEAKNSGVNAIKFQTFKAEEFIADKKQTYTYKSQGKEITESMLEMFKRYEFDKQEWIKIKKKCDDEKIIFLSTPQNKTDLELLLDIGVPAIKVGSDDFINIPLLREYSSTKLPLILSCGMANSEEVYESLEAVGALNGYPTILLLTTSEYPTPPEHVNLLKLQTLKKLFPRIPLGYSDHTQGYLASALAVGFGACVFEKHFTLSHDLPGPDHWFSEEPHDLKKWNETIRTSYLMLGNEQIKETEAEKKMKIIARRSIVASRDINKNEILDHSNLSLMRPGDGLPPKFFKDIMGKKALKNIKKGNQVNSGDFY